MVRRKSVQIDLETAHRLRPKGFPPPTSLGR